MCSLYGHWNSVSFSQRLLHVYRNMVSEIQFTFWRVQIPLQIVNTVGGTLMLYPLCQISRQIVCSKCKWMPADNDHMESSLQISAPSVSLPSTAQVQAIPPISLRLFRQIFHCQVPWNVKVKVLQCSNGVTMKFSQASTRKMNWSALQLWNQQWERNVSKFYLTWAFLGKIRKFTKSRSSGNYFKLTRNVAHEQYVFQTCLQKSRIFWNLCDMIEEISCVLWLWNLNRWLYTR